MIRTVLFDLDGTLLPMDQDLFTKDYFRRLSEKLIPHGYDPQKLIDGIWAGTSAMVQNDGKQSNETVFWKCFADMLGDRVHQDKPLFDEFYRKEFQNVSAVCGFTSQAKDTVDTLKKRGLYVALATNPIFPAVATESRIRWTGLAPEDFVLYTSYENTRFCKPNPAYYSDLLIRLGCAPEECLMVGNDVEEDMIARTLGIDVFLLTDCLINKNNRDINAYPHGGFNELLHYIMNK